MIELELPEGEPDPEVVHRRGRGAALNPPNRFERLHYLEDPEALEEGELRQVETQFMVDASRTVLAKNDSPDVPFTYSLNPYRGCEHGCIYCYARPSHEYLGFSAGLDFETRILVKQDAPSLLADAFRKRSWQPQVVALSGNTDPYQPVERRLELTRRCLEVFLAFRNPVGVITKNHLITRDIDLLEQLAALNLVHVTISITSLRPDLIGVMEPRTSRPAARLDAVRRLSERGIPVGVNVAPLIPGITDEEIPRILEAAAEHGAKRAAYIVVRLPGPVQELFLEWLERNYPDRKQKVVNRLIDLRGGKLNDPRFKVRMRGEGEWAETISRLFRSSCKRFGINQEERTPLSTEHFRVPAEARVDGQLGLF